MQAASPQTPSADVFQGWKYFRRLTPLLTRLRANGCERDQAGNRTLHYDQYCALMLLALFNPLVALGAAP